MALPFTFGTVAGGAQVPASNLDLNFNAVGILTIIPCTATGTNALSLSPLANTPTIAGYSNYGQFSFVAPATSSAAVTVALPALAAKKVFLSNGTTQAGAGDLVGGVLYVIGYNQALDGGAGGFIILAPATNLSPGIATPVATKTGDYTVLPADRGAELRMNSAAAHTFTLPSGVTAGNGFNVTVRNINTGIVAVTAPGSDKILSQGNQLTTIHLPSAGDAGQLICDGGSPALWSWTGMRSFTTQVPTTLTTQNIVAHNLDIRPTTVYSRMVNQTPNFGWVTNDRAMPDSVTANSGGGYAVGWDGTNVYIVTVNASTFLVNKTAPGAATAMTAVDWTIEFTAVVWN